MKFRAILLLAVSALASQAGTIYQVALDTSGLGPLGTPTQAYFALTNGSTANTNTVIIDQFSPSGNKSSITLTDSNFFQFDTFDFLLGSALTFRINSSEILDPGGTPDELSFFLLQNGVTITTTDPTSADAFLLLDIGANPSLILFGTPPNGPLPDVTTGSVPEPGAVSLVAAGLAALALRRRYAAKR